MSKSYTITEIYIQEADKKIYGLLYRPENSEGIKLPVVIFGHGFGGTHTFVIDEAVGLSQKGYAVFVFDFCGGGVGSKSSGTMSDMSIMTETEDFEIVLEYIRKRDDIDLQHVYIGGESQGGIVSALTAAKYPEKVTGLILYYPAFVIIDQMHERFVHKENIPDQFEIFGMTVGKRYAEDIWDLDVYEAIRTFDQNVLFIHGDQDDIVPLDVSRKFMQAYQHAQLIVIKGAGHGFYGYHDQIAVNHILDYLRNEIGENE